MWSYNGNDTALDAAGNILPGRVFTVWTAETGGTQLTSTIRNWSGATVSSGQIISEGDGRIRFKETSDTYSVLWVKAPDNAMYPVVSLEAVGSGGGGGGVSLSANNSWTGVQTFTTNPAFNNGAIPQAKIVNLTTDLTAAANPVYRGEVANQAAMLALPAKLGDSVKRIDTGSFWFLWSGSNPATLGNWVEVSSAAGASPIYVWRYTAGAWPSLPATKPAGVSVVFAIGPTFPTGLPSWTGMGASQIPVSFSMVAVE